MTHRIRNIWTAIILMAIAVALAWGAWIFSYSGNHDEYSDADKNIQTDERIYGQWNIASFINVTLANEETERIDSTATVNYYLSFDKKNNSFSCNTDCNSISGTFLISGNSIRFSDITFTEMACDDMSLEESLKKLLPMVANYSFKNDRRISLKDSYGRTLIRLDRVK